MSQKLSDIQREIDRVTELIKRLRRKLKDTLSGTQEEQEILQQLQPLEEELKALHATRKSLETETAQKPTATAGGDYFEHIEGDVYTGDVHIHSAEASLSADLAALRDAYLNWLCYDARQLSLTGIDRRVASSGEEGCQNLDAIYTALLTLGTDDSEREFPSREGLGVGSAPELQKSRLSALAQLNQHQHLVLLGDPGSGKSTFVNFVAMCLAGEFLGAQASLPAHGEIGDFAVKSRFDTPDLALLTAPLPDENGKDTEERQPWQHGVLLPVRVFLRDFAARGLPEDGQPIGSDHVWQFLAKELSSIDPALGDVVQYLKQSFLEHGGLLLLDGLDEVPEAEQYRKSIKEVVEQFARIYQHCRVLVTSRTYAYQKQGWRLKDFKEAVLAPFSKGQICRFVDRWYPNVAPSYDLTTEQAHDRATQLKDQILNNNALYTLAERPLLLTLMASLHAWRLRDLPKKRVELYKETVDLLLDRWERRKFKAPDAPGQPKSLLEWLRTDKEAVLKMLSELAYKAHKNQLEPSGTTADIPEKELVDGLIAISDEEVRPKLLVKYLRERTGLLVPHGVQVYTFPHRTFQEYLAACYLTGEQDYPDNIADLVRTDPNRWREVLLLAAASVANAVPMIWLLADTLCYKAVEEKPTPGPSQADSGLTGKHPPGPPQGGNEDAWGALLAGQALVEAATLEQIHPRNQQKLDRIKRWLVAILTEQVPTGAPFPAVERALAGNILAVLGDPRPGVGLREDGLPDIEWCEVPEGPFLMGSNPEEAKESLFPEWEQPQHTVYVSTFHISRYPVTNAQYRVFVDDGGYDKKAYWTDEGWKWKEQDRITGPETYGGNFDLLNHPVIGVSWYEAVAFCHWLTIRLWESGDLTKNQEVRLPTEAKWEKAARSADGRIFPWGDKITPEFTNYGDTGLGVTNTVGCFPRGVSPYGCEDLAGNVWEWCQDWFDRNYYTKSPKENPEGPASGSNRVDRGGGWIYYAESCRAAGRSDDSPTARDNLLGFRLLKTPS